MTPAQIEELFDRLAAANPAPTTELVYRDPFTLLAAVALSAQATDVSVNRATETLFAAAGTPAAMMALGEDRVRDMISNVNLYPTKARNLIRMCEMLLAEHGGRVPEDYDALVRLPGVGRKTANVVLNTAFGRPTIAIDTHIFRVSNRTGLAPGPTPEAVERGLLAVVPKGRKRYAHHWLLLHGRYVCVARKPLCPTCVIADLCAYPDKTLAGVVPVPGAVPRAVPGAAPARPRRRPAAPRGA